MLANKDVDEWVGNMDASSQAIIKLAQKREDWPADKDSGIEDLINYISNELNKSTADVDIQSMDETESAAYAKSLAKKAFTLSSVSSEVLVEMQGQFSFARGLKVFADICGMDSEKAETLFNATSDDPDVRENIRVSISNLVSRLMLLTRMKIIKDVFGSPTRYDIIASALQQYKKEVSSHE